MELAAILSSNHSVCSKFQKDVKNVVSEIPLVELHSHCSPVLSMVKMCVHALSKRELILHPSPIVFKIHGQVM